MPLTPLHGPELPPDNWSGWNTELDVPVAAPMTDQQRGYLRETRRDHGVDHVGRVENAHTNRALDESMARHPSGQRLSPAVRAEALAKLGRPDNPTPTITGLEGNIPASKPVMPEFQHKITKIGRV